MALPARDLEPVTLQSWPTCQNCLSWSSEGLAVAGGEVVHILTPRTDSSPIESMSNRQWYISTVRTNVFEQSQWRGQYQATLQDVSIGEEQSNSTVSLLSWSPPGVGMHRRSVLGILTSNLVLSLWESDGSIGKWERACVVNHHLRRGRHSGDVASGSVRRGQRIRNFLWSPPLRLASSSKELKALNRWGLHHLIVADDNNTISVFRVSKEARSLNGQWSLDLLARHTLVPSIPKDIEIEGHSLFFTAIDRHSIVSRIHQAPWRLESMQDLTTSVSAELTSTLTILRGQDVLCLKVAAVINVTFPPSMLPFNRFTADVKAEMKELSSLGHGEATAGAGSLEPNEHWLFGGKAAPHNSNAIEEFFAKAMKPICLEYNNRYNLHGNWRARFWGTAHAEDSNHVAACLTLHPSDMIESTTAASERCVVVFERQGPDENIQTRDMGDNSTVHHKLLTFIASIFSLTSAVSPLDRKVICAAATHARVGFAADQSLMEWRKKVIALQVNSEAPSALEHQSSLEVGTTTLAKPISLNSNHNGVSAEPDPSTSKPTIADVVVNDQISTEIDHCLETCEICGADISFIPETLSARCAAGHQFTRCNLCFVAIQEPGISKFCSGCGKQFLSLAKLEPQSGLTLSQVLFEEFDDCPYCHGKFRG